MNVILRGAESGETVRFDLKREKWCRVEWHVKRDTSCSACPLMHISLSTPPPPPQITRLFLLSLPPSLFLHFPLRRLKTRVFFFNSLPICQQSLTQIGSSSLFKRKKKPSDGVISVRLSVVRKNLIYPVLWSITETKKLFTLGFQRSTLQNVNYFHDIFMM